MAAHEFAFLDDRFRRCINPTARVHKLYEGCAWAEGPAWSPGGRSLVWSDIPNDRRLRWDESTGAVGVFRQPAGHTNGNTVDRQGRLVSCEHGGRRVSRTELDGTVITLADSYQGKRLNSPNDVVVKSDDSHLVHRPRLRHRLRLRRRPRPRARAAAIVYRLDPPAASCSSPAMTSSGRTASPSRPTRACSTSPTPAPPTLAGRPAPHPPLRRSAPTARCPAAKSSPPARPGSSTASASTSTGRIWTSAADGVHVYDPDGTLIGKVLVPGGRRQR